MAITFSNLVTTKFIENTQTTQYISTGSITIIDKFTVTNVTSSNVTLSVNIVIANGGVSSSNTVVSTKTIPPGVTDLMSEIVGQTLNTGQFISTIASASSSLTLRISGRTIT